MQTKVFEYDIIDHSMVKMGLAYADVVLLYGITCRRYSKDGEIIMAKCVVNGDTWTTSYNGGMPTKTIKRKVSLDIDKQCIR
jgi:hypothetical protein